MIIDRMKETLLDVHDDWESFVWTWTLTCLAGIVLGVVIALGRYGTLGLTP